VIALHRKLDEANRLPPARELERRVDRAEAGPRAQGIALGLSTGAGALAAAAVKSKGELSVH
jgi:hypothetical protein